MQFQADHSLCQWCSRSSEPPRSAPPTSPGSPPASTRSLDELGGAVAGGTALPPTLPREQAQSRMAEWEHRRSGRPPQPKPSADAGQNRALKTAIPRHAISAARHRPRRSRLSPLRGGTGRGSPLGIEDADEPLIAGVVGSARCRSAPDGRFVRRHRAWPMATCLPIDVDSSKVKTLVDWEPDRTLRVRPDAGCA